MPNKNATSLYLDAKSEILLQTACAEVSGPHTDGTPVTTRIILDLGSQKSYITNKLRDKLNLQKIGSENLLVKTFGSASEQFKVCGVVQVCVKGLDDLSMYITCYTVPTICAPLLHQPVEFAAQNYAHLHGLPLADNSVSSGNVSDIDILIGADSYWQIVTGRVIRGEVGPVATENKLGYILSGPVPRQLSHKSTVVNITAIHILKAQAVSIGVEEGLEHQLARFWELESLGIAPQEKTVYDRFEDTIQFMGGRYEVKMPWKEQHPLLPDNYGLARNRFNQLLLKLSKDRQLLLEYDELIKNQLKSGVVELVQTDSFPETGRVHYTCIPHHPVIRRDKDTTKVRIVYDASARQGGPSLNDCLHAGPSLLPKIVDILIRFRFHKVALVSDVEKAFHQVLIAPNDRDVLRFLWIDNPVLPQPRVTVYRFARAVFGVTQAHSS